MPREDRLGHVREQAGEEQHDEQHDEPTSSCWRAGCGPSARRGSASWSGLPLTTKVPLRPAARLAPRQPDDVAVHVDPVAVLHREAAGGGGALRDDQDEAGERDADHLGTSHQSMPGGSPIGGKPPCTAPTTATPCADASVTAETMMSRTTATIGARDLGQEPLEDEDDRDRRGAERERRPRDVGQRRRSSATAARTSCRCPSALPSRSGIWPDSTWMPTPVRKPISTEADRKSPRNPSRSSRASNSMPPQMSATRLQSATHSGEPGVQPRNAEGRAARPTRMAAVAESAPTTSSLDAPEQGEDQRSGR